MNKAQLNALISLLDDPDPEVFSHIQQQIFDLGVGLIPILEKEWGSNLNPLSAATYREYNPPITVCKA